MNLLPTDMFGRVTGSPLLAGTLKLHMTAPGAQNAPPASFDVNAHSNATPVSVKTDGVEKPFKDSVDVAGRAVSGWRTWANVQFTVTKTTINTNSATVDQGFKMTLGDGKVGADYSLSWANTHAKAESSSEYMTETYRVELFVADENMQGAHPVFYKLYPI